ncbi:MAG: hypothetical protein L0215_27455 [Gemmataceae bacterium]|nr:hypothetical protein [Gemmataceae bacterium]
MLRLSNRSHYEPGLGVSWARLPLLLAVALLTAAGLAWLLKFAYFANFYLIMLWAFLAGMALGGVLYGFVGLCHLRNRWLAACIGIGAGLVAYFGYYQLCFAEFAPPGGVWRVDFLPKYIVFRMHTDAAMDLGGGNPGPRRDPFVPLNWIVFAVELGMIAGVAAVLAWSRARRAYCPKLGQWMRQDVALLPAHRGPELRDAIEDGRLSEFLAGITPASDAQLSARLILEYADDSPRSSEEESAILHYPIYLSVEDFPAERPWYRPRRLRNTLIRQVELETAEVLALRPLFPELARRLATTHAELVAELAEVQPPAIPPALLEDDPGVSVADIRPVPEPFRQRVRGPGYSLRVNLRGAIPLVYFLGGAGLIALGYWLVTNGSLALGWTPILVGAGCFLWGAYTAIFCLGVYENRWIERRLRQEIEERVDHLVGARDPESIFVSHIPRESFAKVKWTMSADLLLLKVDEKRCRLLMEGDCDRYRIPAGAISVCEPQCFFHPADPQHSNELWVVRLVLRIPEGTRELLLSVGHTNFTPMTNARRRSIVEELCDQIDEVRGECD